MTAPVTSRTPLPIPEVTNPQHPGDKNQERTTMKDMTKPKHAEPRDHLWVLAVIAAFALFDVWGAWAQVGDKSGFAVGRTGTGWTLTIIVEAAAGYFLFAWFSAPGRRSRRFAMWSAFATLALSLIGQGSSTLAAQAQMPVWLAVFVKDLPVVTLALIAVLIHMRRLDREEVAEAERMAAEAVRQANAEAVADDERAALRAQLEEIQGALEAAEAARSEAAEQAANLAAANDLLTRKLAAAAARNRTRKDTPQKDKTAGRRTPETEVPKDVDARAEALLILAAEPDISGAKLAERVGKSERWGQTLKSELTKAAPRGPDASGEGEA